MQIIFVFTMVCVRVWLVMTGKCVALSIFFLPSTLQFKLYTIYSAKVEAFLQHTNVCACAVGFLLALYPIFVPLPSVSRARGVHYFAHVHQWLVATGPKCV